MMPFNSFLGKITQGLRWRLGMRVAAPQLESGHDEDIRAFYASRITDCAFLSQSTHYEYPRVRCLLGRVHAGRLLELGCGNGGMTRQLAPLVDHLFALDVSTPSLEAVNAIGLRNVETVESLIEDFDPTTPFDSIVMS